MNRIEDERIKFYLQHEARIREWAGLEPEAREFVSQFYRSIKGDLDAALRSEKIAADGVESFFDEKHKDYQGVGLRRYDWPKADEDPDVRLEWRRSLARFSRDGYLICGVRTKRERYRQPFTEERCHNYPISSEWWPAHTNVDPPDDKFWEGDNLKKYRDYLVATVLKAWQDLAPLVDKAVGYPRS